MRNAIVAAFLLVAVVTVAPNRVESQGIGGLIKKKVTEAAKKKDTKKDEGQPTKDNGPIASQFDKKCGPLTADAVDRFMKGMQTELGQRTEFDRRRSAARPDDQVRACSQKEAMSPDAAKIMSRGITEGASTEQLQKAMAKNREDFSANILKKCGEPVSKYATFDGNSAHKAGAAAAGMGEECYDTFKEIALFFCKGLTAEQQKSAAAQGIMVPGKGRGVWVYAADEAKALAPRCSQLVGQIEATGFKLK